MPRDIIKDQPPKNSENGKWERLLKTDPTKEVLVKIVANPVYEANYRKKALEELLLPNKGNLQAGTTYDIRSSEYENTIQPIKWMNSLDSKLLLEAGNIIEKYLQNNKKVGLEDKRWLDRALLIIISKIQNRYEEQAKKLFKYIDIKNEYKSEYKNTFDYTDKFYIHPYNPLREILKHPYLNEIWKQEAAEKMKQKIIQEQIGIVQKTKKPAISVYEDIISDLIYEPDKKVSQGFLRRELDFLLDMDTVKDGPNVIWGSITNKELKKLLKDDKRLRQKFLKRQVIPCLIRELNESMTHRKTSIKKRKIEEKDKWEIERSIKGARESLKDMRDEIAQAKSILEEFNYDLNPVDKNRLQASIQKWTKELPTIEIAYIKKLNEMEEYKNQIEQTKNIAENEKQETLNALKTNKPQTFSFFRKFLRP